MIDMLDTVNAQVQARAARLVDTIVKPRSVVEIGLGGGGFFTKMRRNVEFVGVDPSTTVVRTFNTRYAEPRRVIAYRGNVSMLPAPDACCDCVVTLGTVSRWHSSAAALGEFRRVLKPGGTLVLGFATNGEDPYPWDDPAERWQAIDESDVATMFSVSKFEAFYVEKFTDEPLVGDVRRKRDYTIVVADSV